MDSYRYGFQNQEKDNEIKGAGNSVNYKYRMHDPRVGRFFAVDPLASKYPWNSPYAFSENRVLDAVELEGLEAQWLIDLLGAKATNTGKSKLIIIADEQLYEACKEKLISHGYDAIYVKPKNENLELDEDGNYQSYAINLSDYRELTLSFLSEHKLEGLESLTIIGHGNEEGINIEYSCGSGQKDVERITSIAIAHFSDSKTNNNGSCFDNAIKDYEKLVNCVQQNGDFVVVHCLVGNDPYFAEKTVELSSKNINVFVPLDKCAVLKGDFINTPLSKSDGCGWTVTNKEGTTNLNSSIMLTEEGVEKFE
jgi:RHS repeat-associated protein